MKIREMTKPLSSKVLNESLAKNFGYQMRLESFTDAQLEDARNKLRTKLSQFEVNESYSGVLESPEYHKTKMFLDVVNQEIFERENEEEPIDDDEELDETEEEDPKYQKIRKRAYEHSIPEQWIDSAISRMKLGESDRRELSAELKLRYDLAESEAGWVLLESEELKAETIVASKDMIDRITGWFEDIAAMRAEQFMELTDSIRDYYGTAVTDQYIQAVKPALDTVYDTLESVRQQLNHGLDILSGVDMETMGTPNPQEGVPTAGFGNAAQPAGVPGEELGPEEPASDVGRMKRESVDYSRRLGIMLTSKKS